jgi:hypothetical protein
MFIARSAAGGVRGAPPAVDKTCCDCQCDEKREPAARSVEKSFRLAFPTGQRQTEQAKNSSETDTNQSKSKSCPEPEGDQESEGEKENGRQTGHPYIQAGNPSSALPASSAGAVAQSNRKQNNTGHGEENKKQQCKKNDRHRLMLARSAREASTRSIGGSSHARPMKFFARTLDRECWAYVASRRSTSKSSGRVNITIEPSGLRGHSSFGRSQ